MVQTCCVTSCGSRSHDRATKQKKNDGVRYFSFPAWKRGQGPWISELTMRRRMAWVAAVGRPNISFSDITRHMLVCSRHFHTGKPAYETNETHPDWAPSLHLGHTGLKAGDSDGLTRRMRRKAASAVCATASPAPGAPDVGEDAATAASEQHSDSRSPGEAPQLPDVDPAPQENDAVKNEQCAGCKCMNRDLRSQVNRLREENVTLKKEVPTVTMDEGLFAENDEKARDEKVNHYTGLPYWTLLQALHTVVLPCLTKAGRTLSPFQMLLLTLMRLRQNLPQQHLAYLFHISAAAASEMFRETIDVLHFHLSPLVHWPARHCLQHTMPHQFAETFGSRAAVILDCFKVSAEVPLDLKAQADSHSKQKHTVKYLMGITPQGSIAFLSKGWEGYVSDRYLTEQCGILSKLFPGDVVLAERGFDVWKEVGLMCAEVKTSGSTGGRAQMEPKSVEVTRQVAHLRGHVGRIIGSVRNKYSILQHTIPASLLIPVEGEEFPFIDKIVTVCSALTNMSPSVVSHRS